MTGNYKYIELQPHGNVYVGPIHAGLREVRRWRRPHWNPCRLIDLDTGKVLHNSLTAADELKVITHLLCQQ